MMNLEELDDERKYWLLGIFCTDGHFNGKNTITFNQQKRDRDILEKVCDILGISKGILQDNRAKKPDGTYGEYVRLRIGKGASPSFIQFLLRCGFTNNKTLIMPIFEIQDSGVRHFLRGVIDGDGCISDDSVLRVIIATAASNFAEFVMGLIKRIDNKIKVHRYILSAEKHEHANHDLHYINITGKDAERLLSQIYDWTEFYGRRKFETFQKAQSQQNKQIAIYRSWTFRKNISTPICGVELKEGKSFLDNSKEYINESYQCSSKSGSSKACIIVTKPGDKRGPHIHTRQTETLTFGVSGLYKISLFDSRGGSLTYGQNQVLYGGYEHWLCISIPPGVMYSYENLSSKEGISISCMEPVSEETIGG